jgi:hypothetical protein
MTPTPPKKIAVAIIHGIGRQAEDFAERMIGVLRALCGKFSEPCAEHIVFKPVYWSPVFDAAEQTLFERTQQGGPMRWMPLRYLAVHLIGDAIAYQPTSRNHWAYSAVHETFAVALSDLAQAAGPDAPLCVIAHSLGTVIASNYIYDLQAGEDEKLPTAVQKVLLLHDTPLTRCHTLALLFTLGSPLALWSLRYKDFDNPIHIPAPALGQYHPELVRLGGWWNLYDRDDVIGYPLKKLNSAYDKAVQADIETNVGGLFDSWNPASHLAYWTDEDIIRPIAERIAGLWITTNTPQ